MLKDLRFRYRAWLLSSGNILLCVLDREQDEIWWEITDPKHPWPRLATEVVSRDIAKEYVSEIICTCDWKGNRIGTCDV